MSGGIDGDDDVGSYGMSVCIIVVENFSFFIYSGWNSVWKLLKYIYSM